MHFCVAAEEFLRFCTVERQLSSHSIQAYAGDLSDFGRWIDLGRPAPEISTEALKAYLQDMVSVRRLSASTVRRRFACLRSFFRRYAALGQCSDPFSNWRPLLPRRKRLPRTLSRVEASSLVIRGSSDKSSPATGMEGMYGVIVRLMVLTGIRVGELCRLRIEDLSPECTTLRIHGKGARDRVAYITDKNLQYDLCGLIEKRNKSRFSPGMLFVNKLGAPLRPQSVRSRLRVAAKQVGLCRRVTPHMLRHTAATLLIESGVDIRFVQRLLGHSSIATTEIYTHVSDEALRTTLARADVLGMLNSA